MMNPNYQPQTAYTGGQSGFNNPIYANVYDPNAFQQQNPFEGMPTPNNMPQQTQQGMGNVAGMINTGFQAIGTAADIVGDIRSTTRFDVEESLPNQYYNPYFQPPTYMRQELPEELREGTGGRAALNYGSRGAATGAQIGTMIAPGIGTAVGAVAGAVGGAIGGLVKGKKAREKREEFEERQDAQEREYRRAYDRYYDILGTQSRARAQVANYRSRSQNLVPYYNSQIYGFV